MQQAVELLGAGPADYREVFASTDAGAGNCLQLEQQTVGGETKYLILDYDPGAGYTWHAFQACCVVAGNYYAIEEPKLKKANDYEMLKALPGTQYWVATDRHPGDKGAKVTMVYEEIQKP